MIHQKSSGPIATLKHGFRKQMTLVTVVMSMIIVTHAKNVNNVSSNILFWSYIAFCLAMIAGCYFNYRLTREMESMDDKVKNNLEQHVTLLEQRMKWQMIVARMMLLLFSNSFAKLMTLSFQSFLEKISLAAYLSRRRSRIQKNCRRCSSSNSGGQRCERNWSA